MHKYFVLEDLRDTFAAVDDSLSHLEFLFTGDFIRQAPNPIVSPVHPQPRNLLNQSFIPPSVVPDQKRETGETHICSLQQRFECSDLRYGGLTSDGVW